MEFKSSPERIIMKQHDYLNEYDMQEIEAMRVHFNNVTGKDFTKADIVEIAVRAMKEKVNQSGIKFLFENGFFESKNHHNDYGRYYYVTHK